MKSIGLALLTVAVAGGFLLGRLLPFGGPVLWAMVVGVAFAPFAHRSPIALGSAGWVAGVLLRAGIVLLGIRISVGDLTAIGIGGLLTAIGTIVGTMFVTTQLGRKMRVDPNLTLLLGTGTAICGASAIAAMATATRSRESDVGYAVGTITLAGTASMIFLPLIGEYLLHLDHRTLGIWLGASIQEVAQVAGAGAAISLVGLEYATMVKLVRVVMLGPLVALAAASQPDSERDNQPLIPWFVVAFLLMIAIRSIFTIPVSVIDISTALSAVFLAAGLGGLGLQIRPSDMRRGGFRPLALGCLAAIVASAIALALTLLTSS